MSSHAEQREALTEDVDGSSGGEQESGTGDAKTDLAKQQKTLRDSAMPFIMISVFLITFLALAATTIYVVTQAFAEKEDSVDEPTPTSSAPEAPAAAVIRKVNATLRR